MKRTTKYVAFDVHQATTVASVRVASGAGLVVLLRAYVPRFISRHRRWPMIGLVTGRHR